MYKFSKIFLLTILFLFPNIILAKEPTSANEEINFSTISWIPMAYEKEGTANGLYIDILNEIMGKHLKKELNVIFHPWIRAQEMVKAGKSDFMITVATPERLKYTVKSEEAFFLVYLYVYTYKNHPKIDQINKIKSVQDILDLDLKVVTNLGNGWHKVNLQDKGVNMKYVSVEDSSILFLSRKNADIAIGSRASINHVIKQRNLKSEITLTKARFGPIKMHLLMSKKSQYIKLMPEINRVFKELKKNGVIEEKANKYHNLK